MRLDDCDFGGIDAISMAPIERNSPEDEWVDSARDGAIPQSLYDLYQRANFLSFGKAPRFLTDEENRLFSYFGLILRSIQEALVDASEQAAFFAAEQELVYDPMKKLRGEKWEKDADKRARRHFRDLLIALQMSLDSLADLVAIFFPGCIKRLSVGKAQFSEIEEWLKEPAPLQSLIASPSEFWLKRVRDSIGPLVQAAPPETDWLPLMRLLRNKAAHLGQPFFRQVGLPRALDGRLFVFIPRHWPWLWESLIKPAGSQSGNTVPIPQLLRDNLVHQDVVSYSRGLLAKVQSVIGAVAAVLNEVYLQFKDLPENRSALIQLKSNSKKYDFENFTDK